MGHKIATCCYCGTRAALKLTEIGRHELSCSACGAPLHDLKQMPLERPKYKSTPANPELPMRSRKKPEKKRKKKRRTFSYREAFEELFDVVEDIFD